MSIACIVYSVRNAEKEDYSVALSKDSLCVHELHNCLKKVPRDQNVAKFQGLMTISKWLFSCYWQVICTRSKQNPNLKLDHENEWYFEVSWETGSYQKSNSGLWRPSWQNISAMKVYKLLVWYVVPLSLAWGMCVSCSLQVHTLPPDDDGAELGTQHMAAALCSVLRPGGDWGSGGWDDHWPTGACRTTLNHMSNSRKCMGVNGEALQHHTKLSSYASLYAVGFF